jgi:4-hydroxy-tetrahydrodipicolinate synthase
MTTSHRRAQRGAHNASPPVNGIIVPIITPFNGQGGVDFPALEQHTERLIAAGMDALFVLGTTGEFHGLDLSQRRAVVSCVLDRARGRVPVVAGIPGDSTASALACLKACQDPRLAGYVASAPYLMGHDQQELMAHFHRLAQAAGRSLILYNFSGRYHNLISPALVESLVADGTAEAIKDSDRDRDYIGRLFEIRSRHPGFRVFPSHLEHLGWTAPQGIEGSVQAIANLLPTAYARAWKLVQAREFAALEREVARLWAFQVAMERLGPFMTALKGGMAARGWCRADTAPPTRTADDATCQAMLRLVEGIEGSESGASVGAAASRG